MATDLEVFRATVNHQSPARVLYYFSVTQDLGKRLVEHIKGARPADYYGCFQPTGLSVKRPGNVPAPDYSKYWAGQELPKGTTINGHGVAMVPSGFYHFWGYVSPLRNATSLKEIEDYPLVDADPSWDMSYMKPIAQKAHAEGKVVSGTVGHMYEDAWQIRGYEQFLMDMIEQPTWAECLLERLFQRNITAARAFAEAGADILRCGDDVANQNAMMFAPPVWRRMMLSRWRKVWKLAKEINPDIKVWYHSDGNIFDIAGELIDAGVDILNPLQPECLDIDGVYRKFGKRVSFDGCIGTQSTMPWGKPGDVKARVKEVIEKYGRHGGLMISPTHVLEPEVPISNIEAMCEACKEYGTFK